MRWFWAYFHDSTLSGAIRRPHPSWVPLALISALTLVACTPQTLPLVDLNTRTSVMRSSGAEVRPLRIAVAAILSAESSFDGYQGIAEYLESRIGRPVELVRRRTYQEINELVDQGGVDIAFICTAAYVFGHDAFGMELLVAPQIGGKTTYRANLIVAADSKAQTMADLRGTAFAFTDPWSMTGRIYPVYLVEQLGNDPEEFFARAFFTYSHDKAIAAVANGLADAASVDSLVFDAELAADPSLATRVRVIDQSQEFGIPPVVISPRTPLTQRALISEALLEMAKEPSGRAVLAGLGFDGFVPIEDAAYQGVRQVVADSHIVP